jgi:hypothetical protein
LVDTEEEDKSPCAETLATPDTETPPEETPEDSEPPARRLAKLA